MQPAAFRSAGVGLSVQVSIDRAFIAGVAAALLLPVALHGAAGMDLASSATYRIEAEGLCYPGQYQAGTNARAVRRACYIASPLMEMSDDGGNLVDGRRDRAGSINTWFWSNQAKLVRLTFSLAGPSTLRRATVHATGADSVLMSTRLGERAWTPWDAAEPTECDAVQVLLQSARTPEIVVSEVELTGDGPAATGHVGLVRARPHWEGVATSEAEPPGGAVLLTPATRPPALTIDSSAAPKGEGANLFDGDLAKGVVLPHKTWDLLSVRFTADLGRLCLIERVDVWLPPMATGYVNGVSVAVSATGAQGDRRVPCPPLVNPYWPSDRVETPYALVTPRLGVAARYVQLDADLVAHVTRDLAIGEVRIWGRRLDADEVVPTVGFIPEPVKLAPEPRGQLAPGLSWIDEQGVRLAWGSPDCGDPKAALAKFKGAGVNVMLVTFGGRVKRDHFLRRATQWAAAANEVNIALMIGRQFGSDHKEPYRRFRAMSGEQARGSCCPLERRYLQGHLVRHLEDVLAIAEREGHRVDGYHTDYEMYESDTTHYLTSCTCSECFRAYLEEFAGEPDVLLGEIPAARRGLWLKANDLVAHYDAFLEMRVQQFYEDLVRIAHEARPDFLFSYAPGFRAIPGLTRGLGTAGAPCIVLSELEYVSGVTPKALGMAETLRREGYPAVYLPGLWLRRHSPDSLRENAVKALSQGAGWWLWAAQSLIVKPRKGDAQTDPYGRVDGTSAQEYFEAISQAHRRGQQMREASVGQ